MRDHDPNFGFGWRSVLPPRPFVFLSLAYLLGMILFTAMRLIFFFTGRQPSDNIDIWSILKAFLIGWRFDQVVILAILLPLLLFLPWLSMKKRVIRIVSVVFLGVILSLCGLLLLSDTRFYLYFGSHLNFQVFVYFNQGHTFWHLILSEPMFYTVIFAWLLLTSLMIYVVFRLYDSTRSLPDHRSRLGQVGWFVLVVSLSLIGIRGRLATAPLSWSLAYFSQDAFINQLGLNGIYTLGRAYFEEGHDSRLSYLDESDRFPFGDFREKLHDVQGHLGQPSDEWLEPDSSLLRLTRQDEPDFGFKPNVIIVVMESFCGRHVSSLGAPHNLTPNFDRLADDGILFTDFYASGTRTSYGLGATLCGFPALPGRSIMSRYVVGQPFISLSEILHDRGYHNWFAYGGDLMFDNMEGFFTARHYDRLIGEDDFSSDAIFAKWGVPDHLLFNRVVALADSVPRPFQLTMLTLSNHEPFDLPDSSVQRFFDNTDSSKFFNAHLYADFALGQFIENMKANPVFDSTVFVFVSDHNKWGGRRAMTDPANFRIPLLLYAPGLLGSSSRRITTTCGQTDVLPTLMGILGDDYSHASWGRDILNLPESDSGFAMINVLNWTGLVEHGMIYEEHVAPSSHRLLDFRDPTVPLVDLKNSLPELYSQMQRRLRIIMQVAEQLSTPATD